MAPKGTCILGEGCIPNTVPSIHSIFRGLHVQPTRLIGCSFVFVEYKTKEAAAHARATLDGKPFTASNIMRAYSYVDFKRLVGFCCACRSVLVCLATQMSLDVTAIRLHRLRAELWRLWTMTAGLLHPSQIDPARIPSAG